MLGPGAISEMAGASSCLNSVIAEPSHDRRITHYSYVLPDLFCTELGINVSGGALDLGDRTVWPDRLSPTGNGRSVRARPSACRGTWAETRADSAAVPALLGDGERDDPALSAAFLGHVRAPRSGRARLRGARGDRLRGGRNGVGAGRSRLTAAGAAGRWRRRTAAGPWRAQGHGTRMSIRHLERDSASGWRGDARCAGGGFADAAAEALERGVARARCFEPADRLSELIAAATDGSATFAAATL